MDISHLSEGSPEPDSCADISGGTIRKSRAACVHHLLKRCPNHDSFSSLRLLSSTHSSPAGNCPATASCMSMSKWDVAASGTVQRQSSHQEGHRPILHRIPLASHEDKLLQKLLVWQDRICPVCSLKMTNHGLPPEAGGDDKPDDDNKRPAEGKHQARFRLLAIYLPESNYRTSVGPHCYRQPGCQLAPTQYDGQLSHLAQDTAHQQIVC